MGHELTFRFGGYSGLDVLATLMPKSWQTRYVARIMLRDEWREMDPATTHLLLVMPWGGYRILDRSGRCVRAAVTLAPGMAR